MRRLLLIALLTVPTTATALDTLPTPAEAAGYRATPTLAETVEFLHRLEPLLPEMRLESFGTSGAGRSLPLVILSAERAFTPAAAAALPKPILLIQNGIHGGEPDGKDACLLLLRDLALGQRRELLEAATVLIVPVLNPDGHDRVSRFNRPNQLGPEEGTGFRTTAAGFDLNRDHVKASTPEMRALLALVNRWRPHLHVDVHVTDGVDHDWVLTWSVAEAPQLAAPLDAWVQQYLPRALAATEAAGHRAGPYVDLLDRNDPGRGFSSWVGGPRYSSGYFPLRHRPSILIEMHSYKPYEQRVPAVRDFLAALILEAGEGGAALRTAVQQAEAATVAAGADDAALSELVLAWEAAPATDRILFPVYDWRLETSAVTGTELLRYRRGAVRPIEVPWVHRARPARTTPRPRGYLVLPGWPAIEERLAAHGLRVERLTAAAEVPVESLWVRDPRFADRPYQGLGRVEATVTRQIERRRVPAGTLWIPADQPDFEVAAQLLEPEAPDSLLQWGLLSTVFERQEYIGAFVLEDLALALLEDEATARAWAAALEDERFAADARARYLWWYQRTPHWRVQEAGRLPVLRVLEAVALPTAPWS